MLYILFIQEKGLRRDYKTKIKKKNFVDSIIFISLHKQPKTELTFLLSHVVFLFFIIISTLRGEIDIILEVLVVCLIS